MCTDRRIIDPRRNQGALKQRKTKIYARCVLIDYRKIFHEFFKRKSQLLAVKNIRPPFAADESLKKLKR